MSTLYDTIGIDYANLRRPDRRIAARIDSALGDARTVINVGAGAGSYEPVTRHITAVEPSQKMIAQRPPSAATVIQGQAESLPFDDGSFDVALAVLTIHHWNDREKGVREMRRVSRGKLVFLTHDPAFRGLWLSDYFPRLAEVDDGMMPPLDWYEKLLGPVRLSVVPVPHDCTDGFLGGYWRRPAAYLDEKVRKAISPFWLMGDISAELDHLHHDLQSGRWRERYGHLLTLDELDCGYRLVETLD